MLTAHKRSTICECLVAWLGWWSEFGLGFSLRFLAVSHAVEISNTCQLLGQCPWARRIAHPFRSDALRIKSPGGCSVEPRGKMTGRRLAVCKSEFQVERVGWIFFIQEMVK